MAKRFSQKQKEEMVTFFTNGKSIEELSKEFSCTKLTISRNLKKKLGEKIYKEFVEKNKSYIDNASENWRAVSLDDEQAICTFRLFPDGTGNGRGGDGKKHENFRTWKISLKNC